MKEFGHPRVWLVLTTLLLLRLVPAANAEKEAQRNRSGNHAPGDGGLTTSAITARAKKALDEALSLAKQEKLPCPGARQDAHRARGGHRRRDGERGTGRDRAHRSAQAHPTATLPATVQTPVLISLFDEAKAQLAAKQANANDRAPERLIGISHAPVDSSKEGETIPIEARLGAGIKAKRVMLRYQPDGTKGFVAVAMSLSGDRYVAEIPADVTAVDTIRYYIEAISPKSKVLATRGSPSKPFIVAIVRTPPAPPAEPEETESPF